MFRPVSVELWLSDKKQVKSCFNHIHDALLQFLLVLTKSLQITRFYGRKSEFRNVLDIMFRCVCVLPSPRSYTIQELTAGQEAVPEPPKLLALPAPPKLLALPAPLKLLALPAPLKLLALPAPPKLPVLPEPPLLPAKLLAPPWPPDVLEPTWSVPPALAILQGSC